MDSNEYLILNLRQRHLITAIATQGRRAAREFVTLYALQYSDNGQNWFYYTDENKIIMVSSPRKSDSWRRKITFFLFAVWFKNFDGNTDDNTIKYNALKEPIVAQYVRFNPRQWNNFIAMRVELYGCSYGTLDICQL